jgi:hypothetical protein
MIQHQDDLQHKAEPWEDRAESEGEGEDEDDDDEDFDAGAEEGAEDVSARPGRVNNSRAAAELSAIETYRYANSCTPALQSKLHTDGLWSRPASTSSALSVCSAPTKSTALHCRSCGTAQLAPAVSS